ncbi:MAG: hypothetical protein WCR46_10700 [Deltaproteobacteria bacterium]
MNTHLYIEGSKTGADSKEEQIRCREGFRKLIEKAGFAGNRNRHEVQDKLEHATRDCRNAYAKGKRSFKVLGVLNPTVLSSLPSFARTVRILKKRL